MQIQNSGASTGSLETTGKSKSTLSVDDFLKIMAAEIQNQTPTGESGSSKTDYMTQLAQFTSLEQMNQISQGIQQLNLLSQATFVGKQVTIRGNEEDIQGVVEKVKFFNNQAYLQVQGSDYPVGWLLEIQNAPPGEAQESKS